MGEIADLLIEGLLDEETGEIIDGDAPGYPRSPARDARNRRSKKKAEMTRCPTCQKVVKAAGVFDHMRDVHGIRK